MPWKPTFPGERPTLGYIALDWIVENIGAPDREDYEPFVPTREQAEFVMDLYELDPLTCKRIVRRGVLSRSRGWGKSPFVSALAILEALGPVVPCGWDADGQPVGMPWRRIRTPLVQIAAASETQTANSWSSLLEMMREDAPVHDNYPGLEVLGGFVNLPGYGKIEPVTTSATALKGKRPVFMVCDQTEQWTPSNGATKVYDVITNNCYKIGGTVLETPNAYTPGMDSQAERTARTYFDIAEGRNKKLNRGLLYSHREAPEVDLTEEKPLREALRFAYGDSSDDPRGCVLHDPPCKPGWSPIDGIMERIWQTDSDEQLSRADWLNQITHASDALLSGPEVEAARMRGTMVPDPAAGEAITLGFDGSRGRARGKPDATALVACRVSDGFMWQIGVWEADDKKKSEWDEWMPPIGLIEAAIRHTFKQYRVVAFYADPAKDWRSYVNKWEAEYGVRIPVKVRRDHPFEWWMTGGRATAVELAVESFEGALRNGDMSLSQDYDLYRHLIAARRRLVKGKLALGKASDYSLQKIDAAVAAVLAWQARLDAVAAGQTGARTTSHVIRAR